MAYTVIEDLYSSYNAQDTNMPTFADMVHMQGNRLETKLQMMLPKILMMSDDINWVKDEFTAMRSALATAVNSTLTTIVLTSGDASRITPPDLTTRYVNLVIDQEHLQATARPGTSTLTVTRGYASTTAAIHANGATVDIISIVQAEGADAGEGWAVQRSKGTNYLQTFREPIFVTRVQDAVAKYGGVGSEIQYQMGKKMREIAARLEYAILFGVKAQRGTATTFRTMGGLWASVASANKKSGSGAIDKSDIDSDIETLFNEGFMPHAIVANGAMIQSLTNLYENRIMADIGTTLGGAVISAIINPLAPRGIMLIPHRLMRTGEYFMLDMNTIALAYMQPFFMKQVPDSADGSKFEIIGDYSFMVTADKSIVYRYGHS